MKFSIITLFPEVFQPYLKTSILGRAQKKGLVEFEIVNLRGFGEGKHSVVDGRPYGGGAGMILRADILAKALQKVNSSSVQESKTILTSASGKPFNQKKAIQLSKLDHIIIVCGHYEGVDQRFIEKYVDNEISIGDYVLTGGELPTMVVVDSVTRLIPGVLKKPEATEHESFSTFLLPTSTSQFLEYPQFTRPEEFEGLSVPEILKSGNHSEIEKWRKQKSLEKTKKVRPDLLERV